MSGLVIGFSIFICTTGALMYPLHAQSYTILHSFSGGGDGFQPMYGAPVLSGSTLFGMTQTAGAGNAGTLYKIGTNGTGYQILHHFGVPCGDGTIPRGSLTLSGSTLYGFTGYGGSPCPATGGTLFKIGTDGTGYQRLLTFGSNTFDHVNPYGAPVLSGTQLYGMTNDDLSSNKGAIFAMNMDGNGFQVLHAFAGKPDDGADPYGSLTLVGSRLLGMTNSGGSHGISGGGDGYGVIFSLNTNGSDYRILHHFAGFPDDGNNPTGSLTLVGDKLYGMTTSGGKNNGNGVLFAINTDGTGYRVILDFANVLTGSPSGAVTLWDSRLYGMTSAGGPGGASCTIFTIKTDGSGFLILHGFKSSEGDGGMPLGDLAISESKLFGWTYAGGSGGGVIFSHLIPTFYSVSLPLIHSD